MTGEVGGWQTWGRCYGVDGGRAKGIRMDEEVEGEARRRRDNSPAAYPTVEGVGGFGGGF